MTMIDQDPLPPRASTSGTTGTRATRLLGLATIVSMAWLVAFGLGFSPADRDQEEAVRILYVHVPTIWIAYLAFVVTALGVGDLPVRPQPLARVGTASPARAPRSAWRSSPSPSSSDRCGDG